MVMSRIKEVSGRAFKRLVEAREEQARRLIELHRPSNRDRF
ncbi:hypothetical protein [Aureimonas populi]|uniref:Uncharacterized protein n=1 Tax=Aureimonas populi TaxID=1701758 RepID=A0ABW5CL13_9HYPH|nr:hypothetical protein [Aureimonas populi]